MSSVERWPTGKLITWSLLFWLLWLSVTCSHFFLLLAACISTLAAIGRFIPDAERT